MNEEHPPQETLTFRAWPKIPRLKRGCIITEKIDGTNAAIVVTADGQVGAQSRKRLITPEDDNFGFASWVKQHEDTFREHLEPGWHYGEWWGSGIQRGYGLTNGEKRFSFFNVLRYTPEFCEAVMPEGVSCVPELARADFSIETIDACVADLRDNGSRLNPDTPAEGVVVLHVASRQVFKVMCENDEVAKGELQTA